MLDQLDYLIRTLTYKRSSLECDLRKVQKRTKEQKELELKDSYEESSTVEYLKGQINGLGIAISELYKMLSDDEI